MRSHGDLEIYEEIHHCHDGVVYFLTVISITALGLGLSEVKADKTTILVVLRHTPLTYTLLGVTVFVLDAGWSSWQLVGLITRRSQVQVLFPQPYLQGIS